MEPDAAFRFRWIFYVVLLIGMVMLAFAGVTFIRMDTAEFQQYVKRSVGGSM
jgi:hypothetical protein